MAESGAKADSFRCIRGLLREEPNQELANEATKEFYEILKYESCAIPQSNIKIIYPEKEWDDNQRKEFPNLFDVLLQAYKMRVANSNLALIEMKVLLDKRKAALILQQQAQAESFRYIKDFLREERNQKLADEAKKELDELLKYESQKITLHPTSTAKRIDPEKEWDEQQRKEFPKLFDILLDADKNRVVNSNLTLNEMKTILDKRKAALLQQEVQKPGQEKSPEESENADTELNVKMIVISKEAQSEKTSEQRNQTEVDDQKPSSTETKSYPTQQIPIIQNKWAFCDICGTEGNMNWKCIQCMQIMCDRCKMAHGNARASMNHFIFHKSDQSKEALWIKVYKCRDHREKNVSLFCMDDKRCICQICHIKSHKGHEVIEYEDYADMVRQRINTSIEEADNLQRAASAISTETTTFSNMLDDEKKKLQEISKKHHAISDALTNDLQSLKVMKERRDAEVIYREEETASLTAKMKSNWAIDKEKLLSSTTELERIRNRLGKEEEWKSIEGSPEIAMFIEFARPKSIAENFAELYDNEWTDAFEEMYDEGRKERETIIELLKILERSYKFCEQQSKELHEHLNSTLKKKVQSESQRKYQTISFAVSRLTNIQEEFCKTEQILTSYFFLQRYARRCVALCLLMNIKDPPMVMDTRLPANNRLDPEKFRQYTKTGNRIDYLVWPVIYLYEGGPLISKGVAQPK